MKERKQGRRIRRGESGNTGIREEI